MGHIGGRVVHWVDDVTLASSLDRSEAVREAGELLASFRWQLYVVLTYAYPSSSEGAQKAIERWFERLREQYPRCYIHYMPDRGKATGRWNVHVVLGGLFLKKPLPKGYHRALAIQRAIATAKRFWKHGKVKKIEPYDARRGAPHYMAQYWNDDELPGQFLGQPIRKKKRRRRAREQTSTD